MTSIPRSQQLPLFVFSHVCIKCGIEQPLEAFEVRPDTGKPRNCCKPCIRKQARENRKRRVSAQIPCIPDKKLCPRCQQILPSASFYRNKSTKDGLQNYCKACKKAYEQPLAEQTRQYHQQYWERHRERLTGQKRHHYQKHKNVINARVKQYREANKESVKGRKRQEYLTNKDAYVKRSMRYQQEHRDTHNAQVRKYAQSPKGKHVSKESGHRRRARIFETTSTPVDYVAILERDGCICFICGKPIDTTLSGTHRAGLTFDHEKPLSGEGECKGTHSPDNIHPAHRVCNIRKGAKLLSELTPWQRRGI